MPLRTFEFGRHRQGPSEGHGAGEPGEPTARSISFSGEILRAPNSKAIDRRSHGRMIRQSGEHVREPSPGIDIVELGGLDSV